MYLGYTKKYHFYSLELHRHSDKKLERISKACEQVEKKVWNACEDFNSYLKRQSALIYAKYNDEVVGFTLFDLSTKEDGLIFAANECMVLKEHQGNGLPTLFLSILVAHIRKDNRLRKNKRPYKSVTFVSSTVSYKLMGSFKRYGWLAKRDSFRPDTFISAVAQDYVKKENWTSFSENIFFIESAFPNAVKLKGSIEKPLFVPKNFVVERGDAFLYVCRITNFVFLGVMSFIIRKKYGFHFSKRLLNISRIVRDTVIYSQRNM